MKSRIGRVVMVFALTVQLLTACGAAAYADTKPVNGTLYAQYEKYITYNAIIIQEEISGGGTDLVKGITLTGRDKKQWKSAEKRLRRGLYGDRYAFRFSRTFSSEIQVLGFIDTVVAYQYRYLELRDLARSVSKPYHAYLCATRRNKKALDYYAKRKKKMEKKLDKLYKKEIAPYQSGSKALQIALMVNLVDNYFTYQVSDTSNNLAYTINSKKGVCADYSYMLDYFLKKAGFKARLVSIRTDGDYHMVNAVKIKGAWFYIDPTNMDRGDFAFVGPRGRLHFSSTVGSLAVISPDWKMRSVY